MALVNHYATLGVSEDATLDVIKAARRSLLLRYHSDKSKAPGAHDIAAAVSEAFDVLKNSVLRAEHDAKLKAGRDAERAKAASQAKADYEARQKASGSGAAAGDGAEPKADRSPGWEARAAYERRAKAEKAAADAKAAASAKREPPKRSAPPPRPKPQRPKAAPIAWRSIVAPGGFIRKHAGGFVGVAALVGFVLLRPVESPPPKPAPVVAAVDPAPVPVKRKPHRPRKPKRHWSPHPDRQAVADANRREAARHTLAAETANAGPAPLPAANQVYQPVSMGTQNR